ncbi:MAG: DUF2061 domain-containing protein [Verrucomicrobia bacterium]|nr:DUF2061 domain-containing protein [Verrucomicrobiota bacterium]MDA1005228.1 DUF2061 domain-containing protein [Verrucomicrobiota bacterium]
MKKAPIALRESNVRSLLKAVSWRLIATGTTILIAWLVYGDIKPALAIGGLEFLAKFAIYYLHERMWQVIPHGTFPRVKGH